MDVPIEQRGALALRQGPQPRVLVWGGGVEGEDLIVSGCESQQKLWLGGMES